MELTPDSSWTRPGGGDVVLAGSPLTLFRLTPGGRRIAEALEAGLPLPAGHEALTDRLLAAGAVHPVVAGGDAPAAPADIAVVIPAKDEDHRRLERLVASLRTSPQVAEVVVVDDGSTVPMAPVAGAEVVRLATNRGPAAARTAGLAATSAPFVFTVDADVAIDDAPRVLAVLRAHLGDTRVAAAAPRVRAAPGPGWLAAFDAHRSPLDLGAEPARVRALSRVSYVPSAALLLRRAAVEQVGGFDPALRFGEDVDLVWRLDAAGWGCRYEPAVAVEHTVRPTLRRWCRQRRQYGTAAAPLARRHPGQAAPLRIDRWSAAAWALAAVGHPLLGAGTAAATTAVFARTLPDMPERTSVALRYAGLGNLHAGRLLAAAITRSWWPVALVACLISRRARRAVAAALLVPALVEWARLRPRLDPVRWTVLRSLDDASYGLGVWQGCVAERSAAALAPDLTGTRSRRPAGR